MLKSTVQRGSFVFVYHSALYIIFSLLYNLSDMPCEALSSTSFFPSPITHLVYAGTVLFFQNVVLTGYLSVHSLSFRCGYEACKATADWLQDQAPVRPLVGIVCGSGLGGLADMLKDQKVFNYSDIPNFPQSTGELAHYINMFKHLICMCVDHLISQICVVSRFTI